MFSTILFPVDQSRESREAADVVASFVQENHSDRLVLLSVLEQEPRSNTKGESPRGDGHSEAMGSHDAIVKLLATAKTLFDDKGIVAEVQEREGKPAFAICDMADEIHADLIIMGCRGIGLTQEGASESVTNRVINLAPCPVLVVP